MHSTPIRNSFYGICMECYKAIAKTSFIGAFPIRMGFANNIWMLRKWEISPQTKCRFQLWFWMKTSATGKLTKEYWHCLVCLYMQWWLWEDRNIHYCQHPVGAAEDRRSSGCLPHSSGAEAPTSGHGTECGKLRRQFSISTPHHNYFCFVTQEQYEYCYKTVLEYLDSFELYANFK